MGIDLDIDNPDEDESKNHESNLSLDFNWHTTRFSICNICDEYMFGRHLYPDAKSRD